MLLIIFDRTRVVCRATAKAWRLRVDETIDARNQGQEINLYITTVRNDSFITIHQVNIHRSKTRPLKSRTFFRAKGRGKSFRETLTRQKSK